jgi:hypothetical protein
MAEDPVAQLYGLPLNDFVPSRDTLARELRREGDKERAAEVAKLKRPSVAAWAVNQLARRERKELDLLLDAGHRLRTGQQEVLEGGDRERFEAARRDHDRAVRKLVASARELLGSERGTTSEQMLSSIERTLRYASIDEEQRAALASGVLTAEVDAPGFGAFTGIALPPAPPPQPVPPRRPATTQRDRPKAPPPQQARRDRVAEREERKARIAAAQGALRLARDREREARQSLREAERTERKAARDFERAAEEVAAARAELEAAGGEVQEASERLDAERAG